MSDELLPDLTGVNAINDMAPAAPPGGHLLRIHDVEWIPRNQNGNPQLKVQFRVVGGAGAGCGVRENYTLNNDVGKGLCVALLQAVGITNLAGVNPKVLEGRLLWAECQDDYFQGRNGQVRTSKPINVRAATAQELAQASAPGPGGTPNAPSSPAAPPVVAGKEVLPF